MINETRTRRGRPKSRHKHEQILAASSELFMSRGYDRTSMDQVARLSGVSKQTLYSHFQNKSQLFRACIASKVDDYELDLSVSADDGSFRENVFRFGCNLFDLFHDPRVISMHRLLMSEATEHQQLCRLFYDAGPLATKKGFAQYLLSQNFSSISSKQIAFEVAENFIGAIETSLFLPLMLGLPAEVSTDEKENYIGRRVDWLMKSLEHQTNATLADP